ncbi:MAG TPA: LytTR family DNA-binding domain-containing protein [Flavisolibacter sp.]|jgi:DNA-binding LytR/AlgR family response regulator|nr:LytTR family DNA-binding domain-containing protein [Flavisolibacter sp.]
MANQTYNCLVVDDEPIARKIIKTYIDEMPFLTLAAECINAVSAINQLRVHNDIHIIFLDINMPNLSGLQLLKIIQPKQPVIFTTAYAEHAIESYELNAVDYLLKPFSFERFSKAVYKAVNVLTPAHRNHEVHSEKKIEIFIKSDGKNYPVVLDDILYCEAMKNYTMVVLQNGQKLMPLMPLTKFEAMLSDAGGEFIQVHRSFFISKKHITSISSSNVAINQFDIPIGIQFRERFFKAVGIIDNG